MNYSISGRPQEEGLVYDSHPAYSMEQMYEVAADVPVVNASSRKLWMGCGAHHLKELPSHGPCGTMSVEGMGDAR